MTLTLSFLALLYFTNTFAFNWHSSMRPHDFPRSKTMSFFWPSSFRDVSIWCCSTSAHKYLNHQLLAVGRHSVANTVLVFFPASCLKVIRFQACSACFSTKLGCTLSSMDGTNMVTKNWATSRPLSRGGIEIGTYNFEL